MPMTDEQFGVPFHRLVLAYDRFAFLKDEADQDLLTTDWYECFKHYGPEAWSRAVDVWKRRHPKFPAQSEMHALLLDLIPDMIREREEAERQERLRLAGPPDPKQAEALKEKLRALKQAMQLKPPAPASPLLEDRDD